MKRIFFPPNLSSLIESQALKLEEVIYYLRPNALDQRVMQPTLGWEELLLKLVWRQLFLYQIAVAIRKLVLY